MPAQPAAPTFIEQLGLSDPKDRLIAALQRLDAMHRAALSRRRAWGSENYADPDTNAAVKCEELARALMAEYHARACASIESIATLDRKQAIAELRAVLEAWEDPAVTDEAWAASRRAPEAVQVAPRATVVRRKKM